MRAASEGIVGQLFFVLARSRDSPLTMCDIVKVARKSDGRVLNDAGYRKMNGIWHYPHH
ncbi:hypothetical protein EV294_108262 [Paenibacillus sp. BK033]|nr:hypothetical protein [Paenibacillus sp. BK720]TCM92872.1 hypothetical protein EV294_108262 [Paenibacillus sp. BK033]